MRKIYFISEILKSRFFLKLISVALCLVLLFNDGLVYASGQTDAHSNVVKANLVSAQLEDRDDQQPIISIPEAFGTIEQINSSFQQNQSVFESKADRDSSVKNMIYIQDAHDSLEAQENIAKIIDYLVQNYGVTTVFEEGYEGPLPSDQFFSGIEDAEKKKKLTYFFMDRLRLGGAEYAHINREREFQLIGIDDEKLYTDNLLAYKEAADFKDEVKAGLNSLQNQLQKLAKQSFPKEVKEWLRIKKRFDQNDLDLVNYLIRVRDLLAKNDLSLNYPLIDFMTKAHQVKENKNEDDLSLEGFDAKALFREMDELENALAESFLQSDSDRQLFKYLKGVELLLKLNEMEVTAAEYEVMEEMLASINTQEIAQFIANKTKKSMALSKTWEADLNKARRFYELAHQRDEALAENVKRYAGDEKIFALVFGGFHKNNIQELLKEQNYNVYIVTPKISSVSKRHQNYYKQLMGVGHHAFETPMFVATAAKPLDVMDASSGYTPELLSRVTQAPIDWSSEWQLLYPQLETIISGLAIQAQQETSRSELRNEYKELREFVLKEVKGVSGLEAKLTDAVLRSFGSKPTSAEVSQALKGLKSGKAGQIANAIKQFYKDGSKARVAPREGLRHEVERSRPTSAPDKTDMAAKIAETVMTQMGFDSIAGLSKADVTSVIRDVLASGISHQDRKGIIAAMNEKLKALAISRRFGAGFNRKSLKEEETSDRELSLDERLDEQAALWNNVFSGLRGVGASIGGEELEELVRPFWTEFAQKLSPKMRVLEYGSGNEPVLKYLNQVKPDLEMHALDIAEVDISRLPRGTKFHQMPGENLGGKLHPTNLPKEFDAIVGEFAWEYSLEREKVAQGLFDILKEGGRLQLLVHHKNSIFLRNAKQILTERQFLKDSDFYSRVEAAIAAKMTAHDFIKNIFIPTFDQLVIRLRSAGFDVSHDDLKNPQKASRYEMLFFLQPLLGNTGLRLNEPLVVFSQVYRKGIELFDVRAQVYKQLIKHAADFGYGDESRLMSIFERAGFEVKLHQLKISENEIFGWSLEAVKPLAKVEAKATAIPKVPNRDAEIFIDPSIEEKLPDDVKERIHRMISEYPRFWKEGDYSKKDGFATDSRAVSIVLDKPIWVNGEEMISIELSGVLFTEENYGEDYKGLSVLGTEFSADDVRQNKIPELDSSPEGAIEFSMYPDGKPKLSPKIFAQVGGHGAETAKHKYLRSRETLPERGLKGPRGVGYAQYQNISKDGVHLGVYISAKRRNERPRLSTLLDAKRKAFLREFNQRVEKATQEATAYVMRTGKATSVDRGKIYEELAEEFDFQADIEKYGRELRELVKATKEEFSKFDRKDVTPEGLYPNSAHFANVSIDIEGNDPTVWYDLGGWWEAKDVTKEAAFGYIYHALTFAVIVVTRERRRFEDLGLGGFHAALLKGFFHDELDNPLFDMRDLRVTESGVSNMEMGIFSSAYRDELETTPPLYERTDLPFVNLLREMLGFNETPATKTEASKTSTSDWQSGDIFIDTGFLGTERTIQSLDEQSGSVTFADGATFKISQLGNRFQIKSRANRTEVKEPIVTHPMGSASAPKTLSEFLGKLGEFKQDTEDPFFIPFTISESGHQFIFEMFKNAIVANMGPQHLEEMKRIISEDGFIVRHPQTATPLGLLFRMGKMVAYFDFEELSRSDEEASTLHTESWVFANRVAQSVYHSRINQFHILERIILNKLSGETALWEDARQVKDSSSKQELLSLFVLTEIQDWSRKADVFLRPEANGSEEFQRLLSKVHDLRPEYFEGVVGVGGVGTGIDSLLSIQFGAKKIIGSELYHLMHTMAELNISFAKETGNIPADIPVQIDRKDGIPEDASIETLIFNLPLIIGDDKRITLLPANVDIPAKLLPSTGALKLSESDFKKILSQISALLSAGVKKRALLRFDMENLWGEQNNVSEYLSKVEAYLNDFGLAVTGYYGDAFIEVQSMKHSLNGKWQFADLSGKKLEDEVYRLVSSVGSSEADWESVDASVPALRWFLEKVKSAESGAASQAQVDQARLKALETSLNHLSQMRQRSELRSEAAPITKHPSILSIRLEPASSKNASSDRLYVKRKDVAEEEVYENLGSLHGANMVWQAVKPDPITGRRTILKVGKLREGHEEAIRERLHHEKIISETIDERAASIETHRPRVNRILNGGLVAVEQEDTWQVYVLEIEGLAVEHSVMKDIRIQHRDSENVEAMVSVAREILALFELGIIPRDIKGDNLLVAQKRDDDGEYPVQLIDLGLYEDVRSLPVTDDTIERVIGGTMGYLPLSSDILELRNAILLNKAAAGGLSEKDFLNFYGWVVLHELSKTLISDVLWDDDSKLWDSEGMRYVYSGEDVLAYVLGEIGRLESLKQRDEVLWNKIRSQVLTVRDGKETFELTGYINALNERKGEVIIHERFNKFIEELQALSKLLSEAESLLARSENRETLSIPVTRGKISGPIESEFFLRKEVADQLSAEDRVRIEKLLAHGNDADIIAEIEGEIVGVALKEKRTVALTLKKPIVIRGREYKALKIKGILIPKKGNVEVLNLEDAGQPSSALWMENGRPVWKATKKKPRGGMRGRSAETEFNQYALIRDEDGFNELNVGAGFGVVQNKKFTYPTSEGLEPESTELSYELILMEDKNDVRVGNLIAEKINDFMMKNIVATPESQNRAYRWRDDLDEKELHELGDWLRDILQQYAKTLRRFNKKASHGMPTSNNVTFRQGIAQMDDLSDMNLHQNTDPADRLGYLMDDFNLAFTIARRIYEAPKAANLSADLIYAYEDLVTRLLDKMQIDPVKIFIENYFENTIYDSQWQEALTKISSTTRPKGFMPLGVVDAVDAAIRSAPEGKKLETSRHPVVQLFKAEFSEELALPFAPKQIEKEILSSDADLSAAETEAYRSELREQMAVNVTNLLNHPRQKGTLAMPVALLGKIDQAMRDELLLAISGRDEIKVVLYKDSAKMDAETLKWRDLFGALPNVVVASEERNQAIENFGNTDSIAVDLVIGQELIDENFSPGKRIKSLKHVRLKELGDVLMAKIVATIPEEQLWWIKEVNGEMEMLEGFRSELRAMIAQQAIAWSA
jgi:hypothetical protein